MSTYEPLDLTRYCLRKVAHRLGCLWLVLFLIAGFGMADIVCNAGLAEAATTGAIQGKILEQGGRPLANIQVMALKQEPYGGIPAFYGGLPYSDLFNYPPWTPEEMSTPGSSFYSYGYSGTIYGYPISPAGASAAPDFSQPYRTSSKADGTFLLSNLPEGRYNLWAYDTKGRGFEPVIFGVVGDQTGSALLAYSYSSYSYSTQNILIKVSAGNTAGPFTMTMSLGGTLSGRVTDADSGLAIKGAAVQAYPQPEVNDVYSYRGAPPRFFALTDSNGNYTFNGLPEGKNLVTVMWAEGYIAGYLSSPTFDETTFEVVAGQETSGCNLTQKAGGTISGRVTSQVDGKPVSGAQINCSKIMDNVYGYYTQSAPIVSGTDGTYRISGLEPGMYVPMVEYASGFQGAYYPNTQDAEQAGEIQVEGGKEIGSIDFQLAPSKSKGIIRGQVIDKQSGLPLAGIQVNLNQAYYPYPAYPLYASTSSYSPYGSGLLLRNRAEVAVSAPVAVPGSAPVAVSTTVTVNGTGVSSTSPAGNASYGITATRVAADTVNVNVNTTTAAAPASAPLLVSGPVAVPPPPPADTVVAPTSFMSATSGVGGAVSIYGGVSAYPSVLPSVYESPLPPLDRPGPYSIQTDQQGRFEFTGLADGEYSLNVYDMKGTYLYANYPEYTKDSRTGYYTMGSLKLSSEKPVIGDIEIPLRKGGCLQGKVVAGSASLAGVQVMVIRTSSGGVYTSYGYSGISDITDTAGEFSICGLEEGEYTLLASYQTGSQNYMPTYCAEGEKPRVFEVSEGSTTGKIVISMKTGASISGKVVDKAGNPLAGIMVSAEVEWKDPGQEPDRSMDPYYYLAYPASRALTAEDGTYTVNGLSAGTYTLRTSDQKGEYQEDCCSGLKVTPPGKTFAPNMVMPRSVALSGKVFSQDGQPLSGIYVSARAVSSYNSDDKVNSASGSCSSYQRSYGDARTQEDGTYRITGIAAGNYQLDAYDQDNNYLSSTYRAADTGPIPGTVTVTAGEEKANLDFHLTLGGTIQGTIRDAITGQPVSGLMVTAIWEGPLGSSDQPYYSYYGKPDDRYGAVATSDTGYAVAGYPSAGYTGEYASEYKPGYTPEPLPPEGFIPPETNLRETVETVRAEDNGELYIKVYRGEIGDEVKIPVIIRTASHEVSSLGFEMTYDPGVLEFQGFTRGDLVSSFAMFDVSLADPGRLRVGGYSFTKPIAKDTCDVLVWMQFKVYGESQDECTPMEVTNLVDDLLQFTSQAGYFCTGDAEPVGMLQPTVGRTIIPLPYDPVLTTTASAMPASATLAEPMPVMVTPSSSPVVVPSTLPTVVVPPPVSTSTSYYPGQSYSAAVDSQGNYRLAGLAAGRYIVYVSAESTGKNYISQYYSGVSSAQEATRLEVDASQTIEHIDFNLSPGVILEGTVKDAETGQPITGGSCIVTLVDEIGIEVMKTYTAFSGGYRFVGLRPGTYLIRTDCYNDYYPGYYCKDTADPQVSGPTNISVSLPGPVAGIDIFLQPKASISGRVVDEFDQKPLTGITVMAMPAVNPYAKPSEVPGKSTVFVDYPAGSPVSSAGSYPSDPYYSYSSYPSSISDYPYPYGYSYYYRSATTDADGLYTLKGLEEGDYVIMALDYSHIYAREYYKDVPLNQSEKATVIHVGKSGNTGGIDLELQVGDIYTGQDETLVSNGTYPVGGLYGASSYGGYPSYPLAYAGSSNSYYNLTSTGSSAGLGLSGDDRQAQWYGSSYGSTTGVPNQGYQPSTQPTLPPAAGAVPSNVPSPEIISSNSVETIKAGRTFSYEIKVKDSDAAPLKYVLMHGPEGMTIDDSGKVQWNPSNSDAGPAIIQVKVDNGAGQVALQAFRLGVEADTTPPEDITVLKTAQGDKKVTLSWTPSMNAEGDLADQILYIKEGNNAYGSGISLGKATGSYTVENLKNDLVYTFKITTSDELENESRGVTATATPARQQTANTGNQGNQWSLWNSSLSGLSLWLVSSNSLFGLNNASITGLWGVLPYSTWSATGSRSSLSSWSSSTLFSNSSTSTLGLWNTSPVTSVWGNYSTNSSNSSAGLFGNNSLWNSSSSSAGNLFTNQDYRSRSVQPWNLFY
ncbi:MAG: carboxypeptidase regulatory-like domain-containing protein [bacterium]